MKWTTTFVGSVLLCGLMGCEPSSSEPTTPSTTNSPSSTGAIQEQEEAQDPLSYATLRDTESAVPTESSAVDERTQFLVASREELQVLEGRIGELSEQATNYNGEMRAHAESLVESLEDQAQAARTELRKLEVSTGAAWQQLKHGFDAALAELKKSYADAKTEFG